MTESQEPTLDPNQGNGQEEGYQTEQHQQLENIELERPKDSKESVGSYFDKIINKCVDIAKWDIPDFRNAIFSFFGDKDPNSNFDNDQSSSVQHSPQSININDLGLFLDGWSELVEGKGKHANEVREKILRNLINRGMPKVKTDQRNGYTSSSSRERRIYLINKRYPGATTTVYIAKHGSDLYVSWRTFIKPVLNTLIIFFAGLISFGLGLFVAYVLENRYISYFDIAILMLILFIVIMGGIAIAGKITKGNFLANFYVETNIFNAEDITAMSLTTHKSILGVLDSVDIDVSKLRVKQEFTGGRRGELV